MNPDIAAHYRAIDERAQAVRDRKRLMSLARAWVRKGGGPDTFLKSLERIWPTGVTRLGGPKAITSAWYLALGGF